VGKVWRGRAKQFGTGLSVTLSLNPVRGNLSQETRLTMALTRYFKKAIVAPPSRAIPRSRACSPLWRPIY
jgi:hypothetical protein